VVEHSLENGLELPGPDLSRSNTVEQVLHRGDLQQGRRVRQRAGGYLRQHGELHREPQAAHALAGPHGAARHMLVDNQRLVIILASRA
jgi:hypothetical protein